MRNHQQNDNIRNEGEWVLLVVDKKLFSKILMAFKYVVSGVVDGGLTQLW